jgi:hypothetical protein
LRSDSLRGSIENIPDISSTASVHLQPYPSILKKDMIFPAEEFQEIKELKVVMRSSEKSVKASQHLGLDG